MEVTVHPSTLCGTVTVPGSKSHAIRAVRLASLADGVSSIHRPPACRDVQAAARAARALGAEVDCSRPDEWRLAGAGGLPVPGDTAVDAGNSGTTLFMATALAGLRAGGTCVFDGDAQTRRRSVRSLASAMRRLGAAVEPLAGAPSSGSGVFCPYRVTGRLRGGEARLDGVVSQPVSALMMACPLAENGTTLAVDRPRERPYLEMTLGWMARLGVSMENAPDWSFLRIPGGQRWQSFTYRVPGDWSAAAFPLVAGAFSDGPVSVAGLGDGDGQGDRALLPMLEAMGARIGRETAETVRVRAGSSMRGGSFDLSDTPDLLPAMAVAGALAGGFTRLGNAANARRKETDRVAVMARELSALGAKARTTPDGLLIQGGRLAGGSACGHGDHRVIMALAVAGLHAESPVRIGSAEGVEASFPEFWDSLRSLGARLTID